MKKKIGVLFFALCPLMGAVAQGQNETSVTNVFDAFSQSAIKGQLRYSAQYRGSNLHLLQDSSTPDISDEKKQQYSSVGGYLGFETAPLYNTSMGMTFYTSNPVGNNPDNRKGLGGLDESDGGQDAYHVLGEAFVQFARGNHRVKAGRQEVNDYRYVSPSDIRMTPVTHQGIIYENRSFDNLDINLGYFSKQKERNATEFIGMVRAARVESGCGEMDSSGTCIESGGRNFLRGDFDPSEFNKDGAYAGDRKDMPLIGLLYSNDRFKFEAWDFYAEDFVNTVYLFGQYTFVPDSGGYSVDLAAQYSDQQDVGKKVAGDIDTWFYGAKVQVNAEDFVFFTGYNEVAYNEDSYDGGTIFVRWGTPQMFNSFQVQDSELSGTKSIGAGLQYDFGKHGILPGVVMRVRYGVYDLPDRLSQSDARQDRSEATFDLRYSFTRNSGFGIFTEMDGLSLQFRLAYNKYETNYDYEAYQAIHGYQFESVTDDFIDARIYLDYLF